MKNNFKKLALWLIIPMAIGLLVGCGDNSTSNPTTSVESTSPTTSNPATTSTDTSTTNPTTSIQEPLPEVHSMLDHWAGNKEEKYITVEEGKSTVITYVDLPVGDSNNWVYVARSFAYDDNVERFGEYKTLHFEGNLAITTGTANVMLKIEQTGGGSIEKIFNFKSEAGTYEISVANVDWTKVQSVLFFPNRTTVSSTGVGNGVITLTNFSLVKTDVNPDYDIDKFGPKTPQEVNTYESGDTFAVTKDWRDGGKGVITPTADGTKWTLVYDKTAGAAGEDTSYAWAQALVTGEGLNAFKKIVFVATGTVGNSAIFKIEGLDTTGTRVASEVKADFTGVEQTVELDIKNANGKAISLDFTNNIMVMIMPDGGSTTAKGTIVLASTTFSKEDVTEDLSNVNMYDETTSSLTLTKGLSSLDAGVYTFAYNDDGSIKVNYTNITSWKFFKFLSRGTAEQIKGLATLKMTLTGVKGLTLIVKPFNIHEFKVTLTGEEQEVELDFSAYLSGLNSYQGKTNLETLFCVKDLAAADDVKYSGELLIKSLVFVQTGKNIYNDGDEFLLTNSLVDSGDKVYTTTRKGAGQFDVAYSKGESQWGTLVGNVSNIPSKFDTERLTIKGTKDVKLLLKANSKEVWCTLTGEEDVFDLALPTGETLWAVALIMAPGEVNVSGTIQILSWKILSLKDPDMNYYEGADVFDIYKGFKENDTGSYAVTLNDKSVTIVANNNGYQFFSTQVVGANLLNLKQLVIKATGEAGMTLLIKPFDKFEVRLTFTGATEQTFIINLADYAANLDGVDTTVAKKFIMFYLNSADEGSKVDNKTLVINSMKMIKASNVYTSGDEFNVNSGYYENDANTYAFAYADGKTTVTANSKSWAYFYTPFYGEGLSSFTKFKVNVTGEAGKTLLVKLFDKIEVWFTFTADSLTMEQTVDLTLEANAAKLKDVDFTAPQKVLMFYLDTADYGATVNTNAVFTINTLSYIK